MKNLVICPKNETLECFLVKSKGWKCTHSIPHKHDSDGCNDTRCCFLSSTNLINCRCEPCKENIESA